MSVRNLGTSQYISSHIDTLGVSLTLEPNANSLDWSVQWRAVSNQYDLTIDLLPDGVCQADVSCKNYLFFSYEYILRAGMADPFSDFKLVFGQATDKTIKLEQPKLAFFQGSDDFSTMRSSGCNQIVSRGDITEVPLWEAETSTFSQDAFWWFAEGCERFDSCEIQQLGTTTTTQAIANGAVTPFDLQFPSYTDISAVVQSDFQVVCTWSTMPGVQIKSNNFKFITAEIDAF